MFWIHSALILTGANSTGKELEIIRAAQTGIEGYVYLLMNTIFLLVISAAVNVSSQCLELKSANYFKVMFFGKFILSSNFRICFLNFTEL